MKYFVAVAECGGFTAAAERCYISQSAISQQISALEGDLGVQLFKREGRKIILTPAGEYFYRRCKAIIAETEEVRAETVRIGSDSESRLTIGYLSAYDGARLGRAVAQFSRLYPEVIISVFSGSHEDLYNALTECRADIIFSDQRRVFSPEAENLILAKLPASVEVAAESPWAARGAVAADEISDMPCIVVSTKGNEGRERDYYEKYLHIGKQFIFAQTLGEARLTAVGGRGYIVVDCAEGDPPPSFARVEVCRSGGGIIERTYCAFWLKRRSNYYIEEFARMLRECF